MTAVTGTVSSTTGSTGWTNPNNIFADDGNYAVSGSIANLSYTTRIYALGSGFSIPSSATIDGIEVGIKGKNGVSGNGFQIIVSGSNGFELWYSGARLSGTSLAGSTQWTATTDQLKILGGATDLWGASSISVSQVNDSSFGFRTNLRNGNATTQAFSMGHAYLTVYYTDAGVQYFQQFFWHEV